MSSPKGKSVGKHRGGHYGNNYVLFDSLKNNCLVECESELEHTMFVSFEADPGIVSYVPHPGEIIITDSDKTEHKTLFDAYVKYKNGNEEYVECKYQSELDDTSEGGDRSRTQAKLQKQWCESHGYTYRVITDQELYESRYRFSNNLYLIHAVKFVLQNETYLKDIHSKSRILLNKICRLERTTIGELVQYEIVNEVIDQLMYLAYRGEIFIDLDTNSIGNITEIKAL